MSLGDRLYADFFEQIVAGRLNVGDRLPSEQAICEAHGVSRPVVRQALLRLRADGLIASQQGRGSFVIRAPAERIRGFASASDVASYLQCHEVRLAVEADLARLAAQRRSDDQLLAIARAHDAFARSVHEGRMSAEEDLAFHRRIAEAAENPFYLSVLDLIQESMAGFMRLTLSLTRTSTRQRAQRVLDEHAALLDAIRDGDGERARIAMQFHLTQAQRRLLDRARDR